MIVWCDRDQRRRARVHDLRGTPLGPVFSISEAETHLLSYPFAVAASDDRFLVVWSTRNTSLGQFYDAAGTPVGARLDLPPGASSVAFDGTNFVTLFGSNPISALRISREGVVDPTPTTIGAGASETDTSIACHGSSCVAAWVAPGAIITVARLTTDNGIVVVDKIPLSVTPGAAPRVATDGTRFLLTWRDDTDFRVPMAKTWLRTMTANEPPTEPVELDQARKIVVAGDDRGHSVVLFDQFDDGADVGAWRVWAREIDPPMTADDAGTPSPDSGAPADNSGGGCCQSSRHGGLGLEALIVLLVVLRRRSVA
jgi:hypothetical protein